MNSALFKNSRNSVPRLAPNRSAVAQENACEGGMDAEASAWLCPPSRLADFHSATVGAAAPPSYTDGVIKRLFWV